jgi:hypothetical protein
MNYNKLREWLSEREHIQWEYWSKVVAKELEKIELLINDNADMGDIDKAREIIKNRLKRWSKNWIPYNDLDEDTKEFDREWADKIIDEVPFKCPLHQCGGLMVSKERGDWQTPDLICTNCGAVYQFQEFNKI